MSKIIMSRTIAENALLNKFDIKALPFYENSNSKALDIEHGDGFRQLRTLHQYPVGYDFSCNIIARIKKSGLMQKVMIEDTIGGIPYYFAWVNWNHVIEYLARVSDNDKRKSISRQLQKDLSTGFVTVRGGTDRTGRYLLNIAPFRITEFKNYENGERQARFAWSKDIFETLITDDCTKQGADGYITLPEQLYPLATQATKAAETINKLSDTENGNGHGHTHLIGSSNPIYKMEVYARMKNTNDVKEIVVDRKELIKTIAPELIDKDGYLKKIKEWELHDILLTEVQDIYGKTYDMTMLKNFYLGDTRTGKSTLYFGERELTF